MDQEQLNIGNCPHCTNIIFKNGVFSSNASFTMRCPSCKKLLEIEIKTRVEIIIKPAGRYLTEKKPKLGNLSAIFGFLNQPSMVNNCALCLCWVMDCTSCATFVMTACSM